MGSPPPLFAVDAPTPTEVSDVVMAPPSGRWLSGPSRAADAPTVPAHAFPHRTPAQLLALARRGLDEAVEHRVEGLQYATAHLAALAAAPSAAAAPATPGA